MLLKYCQNCKTIVPKKNKFCGNCGGKDFYFYDKSGDRNETKELAKKVFEGINYKLSYDEGAYFRFETDLEYELTKEDLKILLKNIKDINSNNIQYRFSIRPIEETLDFCFFIYIKDHYAFNKSVNVDLDFLKEIADYIEKEDIDETIERINYKIEGNNYIINTYQEKNKELEKELEGLNVLKG